MPDIASCEATVLITTKNRRDELRTAIRSALIQTVPVEVLVIDDGSTDGTAELVREEFPGVRLISHPVSRGYVVCRNEGTGVATGAVVFSIDDDAAFSTPDIVRTTLDDFASERVGAVAIPYIDVRTDPRVHQAAPDGRTVYATGQYRGTAYAVRRGVFIAVIAQAKAALPAA